MARKLSLSDLTSANRRPSWAAELRQGQLRKKEQDDNALARAKAAAKEIEETEGVVLPESQVMRMAEQIKDTGDFSIDLPVQVPQVGTVSIGPMTVEKEEPVGLLDRLTTYGGAAVDSFQGALQRSLAAHKYGALDREDERVAAKEAERRDPMAAYDPVSYLRRSLGLEDPTPQETAASQTAIKQDIAALDKAAQANQVNVDRARNLLAGQGATEKWTAQAVLDATSSPTSAVSLIGGPLAVVGVTDVENQEYRAAREAGLSKEDARIWAASQAAPEAASFIPAGKVLSRIPGVKKATGGLAKRLLSPAISSAIKVGKTAGGEAIEEMATGSIQDLAAATLSGMEQQQELSQYAKDQTPKSVGEFAEKRAREGLAAVVMGGTLSVPHAVGSARGEFKQQVEERTQATTEAAAKNAEAVVPKRTPRTQEAPAQGELFPVEEGPKIKPDTEATTDTAPATAPDARSKGGQYKLPLNTPRQPKSATPGPTQTKGGDTYYAPDGTKGSNRRDTATVDAEKAIQTQEKADAKATADALKKAKDQRAAARSKELARLTTEARELPRAERVSHVADQIMDWDNKNPAPTAETFKAPVTPTTTKPFKATPEKPIAPPAAPGTVDATLKDISDKLALGMQEESAKTTLKGETSSFDPEQYKSKIRDVVSDLSNDNSQKSVDAINLINQGKLILAPSAESIGRESTKDVAQFSPADGKMYLYTDKLNKGDTIGAIIRTYHEATHAGQFNDRQGRPNIMRQIMGTGPAAKAQATVLRAANSGNAIAKRAVAKAQKAADGDTAVENLEILPYFVGEVVQARGSTLGQLRGVSNDILSKAKEFFGKATGQKFDVSMRDLERAVQGVGKEVVQTDLKPAQGEDRSMIYGDKADDFNKALKEGRVYDSKDGTRKFVLSDADAKLRVGSEDLLQSSVGEANIAYRLSDVLDHPTLYSNLPGARDIQIAASSTMGRTNHGQYWPGRNLIEINPNVLKGKTDSTLREIILHEVQHWVQDNQQGRDVFSKKNPQPEWESKAVQEYNKARAENDEASEKLLHVAGRIAEAMPSVTGKVAVRNVVNSKELSTFQKANAIANFVKSAEVDLEDMTTVVAHDRFVKSLEKYRSKADAYNSAMANKHKRYTAEPTEAEAFFTQRNADAPQSELPINPETEDADFGTEQGADMGRMALARELRQGVDRRGPQEVDNNAPMGWKTTLGMADSAEVNPVAKRWLPTSITGLFRADKGLSKLDNEIIEHAIASPAGYRMKAEAEMGKYDYAVDQMAAEQGVSKEELNRQIQKDIDALPKNLKTHDENVKAFDAMASKYGEAGQALKAMRDQVDELTLSILQQRADSGIPLTEADKKLYKTLVENMGKYTHRQYAAHAGKLGNKYASAVWKDYEKYKAGKKQSSPTVEANYKKVADATKYLVDNNLSIPDDETLGKLGSDQTRNLYNTWGQVGNPDGLTLDQMKEELAQNRDRINGNTDALQSEAETIAKELLGLAQANSPITTYYRGGKQDNSILKQREAIAPVLRSLMGEIVDPSMRMVMTVAKQSEFVGRNKMLLELTRSTEGDVLPPGTARPKGWVKLEGEGYGPLQGYIVSPNMQSAIGDVQQQLATFEQAVAMATRNPRELGTAMTNKALDLWGVAAGTSKMLQVIWSPMNFVYNFVGGPFTMMTNGNVNPINFGKGLLSAKDLISYAVNPKAASDTATRLVANDVVDSAFVGEIKNEQYRELRKVVMEMAGRSNPKLENLGEMLHKAKAGFKETYAMMDVLYKIANFYHQVDTLTDFYKKNGDVKTPEQIDREAADIVKRTNFTYRRVAPLLKAIESKGFSAFGPYMHEVFRTQIAGVFQGISEAQRAGQAKTPEARNVMLLQASKRLTGIAATWGIIGAASSMLSGITFGEDDRENEAKRSLLPEYLQDQDFVEVGKDKDGKPVLFNVSRFDPIGPATDLMRGILQGGIDPDQLSKKLLDLYVLPRIGPQIVTAVGTTLSSKVKVNRVPLVQELAPESYSTLLDLAKETGVPARIAKGWTNVAETLYPGIASSWRSTNARPVSPDDTLTSVYHTATYLGMQLQGLDPAKPMRFSAMDYADSIKQGRQELVEMFKDNPNRTSEQVLSQVLTSRSKERESFDEMKNTYDGALATGMTKREAAAILKEQKLNAAQIRAVASGDFASSIISIKSLEQYEKRELREAPRKERSEIKDRWKDIKELLKSTSRELEESEDEE